MKSFKRIIVLFLIFSLTGCATTYQSRYAKKLNLSDYISIGSFSKKHGLKYDFDTIDDLVRLYSPEKEILLLFNSPVGIFNGSPFYLKNVPVYTKGDIFIPRQIEKIFFSTQYTAVKPLFDIKTIVIDPGHGGKDPGAISRSGFKEKHINLEISKYLKSALENKGFKVILTRSNDTYLQLSERVDVAKKFNADLFISIHANSNHSSRISGTEIYYLSPSRVNSRERSLALAKKENFQGKNISFGAKTILWDLLITNNYALSVEASNFLYFTFKKLGFNVKSPKKAPFYVLRYAYVPSILVEVGYLSNQYEERALRKKHYQKQVADTIALAVDSLKKRYSDFAKQNN